MTVDVGSVLDVVNVCDACVAFAWLHEVPLCNPTTACTPALKFVALFSSPVLYAIGLTVRFTLVALVLVTAQRLSMVKVTSLGLNALIEPSTTLNP